MKASMCSTLIAVMAALPLAVMASEQAVPVSSGSSADASHAPPSSSQPNDKSDIKLAAAVRRALTKDSSLSVAAHNVKLVASGGTVTLNGVVKSDDEKAKVESIVRSVAGVSQVTNQLQVQP